MVGSVAAAGKTADWVIFPARRVIPYAPRMPVAVFAQ